MKCDELVPMIKFEHALHLLSFAPFISFVRAGLSICIMCGSHSANGLSKWNHIMCSVSRKCREAIGYSDLGAYLVLGSGELSMLIPCSQSIRDDRNWIIVFKAGL